MKSILLVCTGNICRTPMAKALLQRQLSEAGLSDQVRVISAGTFAVVGAPASTGSIVAMANRGLDIGEHSGQQLTESLARSADLILIMEESHRQSIFYSWPSLLPKVFLLSEMAGEHVDISDPYRQPQAAYDKTAEIIENYVRRGFPAILKRLGIDMRSTGQAQA